MAPFEEDGSPSRRLQESAREHGVTVAELPFTRDGYAVHLGRTTLRAVLHDETRTNRYLDWARTHAEPHFMDEPDAPARYARFLTEFTASVGGGVGGGSGVGNRVGVTAARVISAVREGPRNPT